MPFLRLMTQTLTEAIAIFVIVVGSPAVFAKAQKANKCDAHLLSFREQILDFSHEIKSSGDRNPLLKLDHPYIQNQLTSHIEKLQNMIEHLKVHQDHQNGLRSARILLEYTQNLLTSNNQSNNFNQSSTNQSSTNQSNNTTTSNPNTPNTPNTNTPNSNTSNTPTNLNNPTNHIRTIRYSEFLRLGFSFSQHYGIFYSYPSSAEKVLKATASDYFMKQYPPHELEPIFESKEHITAHMKNSTDFMFFKTGGELIRHPVEFSILQNWIQIPTYQELDFETMLWAQSRGLFFLGISTQLTIVDKLAQTPESFMVHDALHNNIHFVRGVDYDPTSAKIWNRIVNFIDKKNLSKKDRNLFFAILFFYFHEESFSMTCSQNYGLSLIASDLISNYEITAQVDTMHEVFNDPDYFGTGFPGGVSKNSIRKARKSIVSLFKELCPSQQE